MLRKNERKKENNHSWPIFLFDFIKINDYFKVEIILINFISLILIKKYFL